MPIPRAYQNSNRAPWNQPEQPPCPDCDNIVHDVSEHEDWCAFQGTPEEIAEYWDAEPITEEY